MTSRGHEDSTGGLAIFVLVVFIWLLVVTWPWWLLAPPIIFVFVLLVNHGYRQKVAMSFTRERVEREIAGFRRKFLWSLFLTGVVAAVVCAFGAGTSAMAWWLIPLVLLALALRLRSLSIPEGHWYRLQRALSTNMLELMVMTSVVLAAYSLALWWLQIVPLDAVTLVKLQRWDRAVHEAHEFLESHEPGLAVLILLSSVVIALRLAGAARPALASPSNRMAELLVKGVKWGGRLSTTAALAASLTFLGTQEGGPTARIGLALREAMKDYDHFQTVTADRVDSALRRALMAKAWSEMPPPLKDEMVRSARFQKERSKFEEKRTQAEQFFHLNPGTEDFPLSAEIPPSPRLVRDTAAAAPGSWTPRDLHDAAREADAWAASAAAESSKEKDDDPAVEMAKEAFDKLSPADKVFDHTPVVDLVKAHYPVFGEFLDVISSSVNEALFDKARSLMVREHTAKPAASPTRLFDQQVTEQAAAAVKPVRFDWSRFDGVWSKATRARIQKYQAAIAPAESRLEERASAQQRKNLDAAVRQARERADLMAKTGAATRNPLLQNRAAKVQDSIARLAELGRTWPALRNPSAAQLRQLSQIYSEFDINGSASQAIRLRPSRSPGKPPSILLQPRGARSMLDLALPDRPIDELRRGASLSTWSNPLDGIASLESHCDERMQEIVGRSARSIADSGKLRTIMGDRYASYLEGWQDRVRAEQLAQDLIRRNTIDPLVGRPGVVRPPPRPEYERPRVYEHPMRGR